MKIRVNLVVEVDPEKWAAVYGCSSKSQELRNDVRTYFLRLAQGSAAAEEAEATVCLAK